MKYISFYDFPVGRVAFIEQDGSIIKVGLFEELQTETAVLLETPLIQKTASELFDYFNGVREEFTVPVTLTGTPFQKTVWNIIRKIPYGSTMTYGDIAKMLFLRGGSQSVGGACKKNPVLFLVPCHRVTAAGGQLGGYGNHPEIKIQLLQLENRKINKNL